MLYLSFVIVVTGLPVFAETVKIGIINTQEVVKNSEAAQDVRNAFLRDLEAKRAVLRAKQESVRAGEEELRSQGKTMSAAAIKDKQENLAREVKDLRRLRDDLEEELKKKDREMTRKLIGEIRQVVTDYSKSKKYTLILEKNANAVVFSNDAIDITKSITKAYDVKKGKTKTSIKKSTKKKK
jgi:outer membrane protein